MWILLSEREVTSWIASWESWGYFCCFYRLYMKTRFDRPATEKCKLFRFENTNWKTLLYSVVFSKHDFTNFSEIQFHLDTNNVSRKVRLLLRLYLNAQIVEVSCTILTWIRYSVRSELALIAVRCEKLKLKSVKSYFFSLGTFQKYLWGTLQK